MKTRFLKSIALLVFVWIILFLASPGACKTVIDAVGRKVEMKSDPQRIIPLVPSLTEILYFMGLGQRVVGVTRFSYHPPEASQKPKVGSYINLNVEKIISLSPDLVIGTADGNKSGVVDLLEQAGIPVFIVNPRNIRQAIETIAVIGRLCGIPDKGHQLSQQLLKRVEQVADKVRYREKPLVFLQINIKPIMTVNRNTFHHDLIRLAGGENMTGAEPITYPRISLEEVIQRKPDVIIISSMERGGRYEKARREWLQWTMIPAVKNGQVRLIDSDIIDRPSPRIIHGLEEMARLIHPGVNWQ
ncbi:MAG: cobalamin-binding protein [Deltaproteobacteria bacterium]|nr:cobalamin-binding protein [Deltaproteobacteria bacterium]